MDNIFNKISISLIVLGIAFYAFAMTFTALIPSILGLLMQVVLFLGRTFPKFHKHFAHINVLILILGMGATYGSVADLFGYLLSGSNLARPLATIEQFTTFVLCLVGFIMAVKSFINARKS
jgi:hypothetical protein|tara:strand:+ start:92 stop:454 length:363 start_codon:yes stop_codon:yes gene_type:complete